MSETRTVAVIVGSLRKDSVSRKLGRAIAALAPKGLRFEEVAIGDLSHFNPDQEADPPPAWVEFRNRVKAADAVLFITPEYNRSIPGFLKNAVDVGSRPYGQSVFAGRPTAVVSVSPGALGAFGANHHLRQVLVSQGAPVLSHEAYIGDAFGLFDESGELTKEATAEFLRGFGQAFAEWIARLAPAVGERKAA